MFNAFILNIAAPYPLVKYLLIFILMVFEGDATLFAAAFLTKHGFFDFYDIIFFTISGAIFGDILWFYFGKKFAARLPGLRRALEKIVSRFDSHIRQNRFRAIFVSKFAYGLNHAVIMRAAMLDTEAKDFIKIDLLASALWFILIGGLGYMAGASYVLVKHTIRFLEIGVLAGVIIFIFAERIISKIIKRIL